MSVREEFDEWAESGRDKGMGERHWHTSTVTTNGPASRNPPTTCWAVSANL